MAVAGCSIHGWPWDADAAKDPDPVRTERDRVECQERARQAGVAERAPVKAGGSRQDLAEDAFKHAYVRCMQDRGYPVIQ